MAAPKRYYSAGDDKVSKSRAFNAGLLTVLTLLVLAGWVYHFIWALQVVINQPYGGVLNNLVYGPGTLVANAGLSTKLVGYLNDKLVGDKIDADHKKYL
ncbi:hypothetical protein PICST_38487 [Scheffersomyces stipitis CBS 6054]|uniref:Uncharacterized protein n=1 Tax=Scheffersomyces stipitis (strain ATCC 58785 / CBS 6054 / NBRC 10063 / NRRL Y-11545) TaxID=322104 RepID=A3GGG9_PICST|nr:predicted protein [Scheffersomyces stipitis CBS 6054]EAZ63928.1 hypothetical protein PICST_38487 [Scheffersomyces stipitis CBS 6054]